MCASSDLYISNCQQSESILVLQEASKEKIQPRATNDPVSCPTVKKIPMKVVDRHGGPTEFKRDDSSALKEDELNRE